MSCSICFSFLALVCVCVCVCVQHPLESQKRKIGAKGGGSGSGGGQAEAEPHKAMGPAHPGPIWLAFMIQPKRARPGDSCEHYWCNAAGLACGQFRFEIE